VSAAGLIEKATGDSRPLIGVVHLLPLPGSPGFDGSMERILERAAEDARAYAESGFTTLLVENFGDTPFYRDSVPPETVASITTAVLRVKNATALPVGVNVLRNDALSALAICAATGAGFIRANVLSGARVTDQGIIEGNSAEVARTRLRIASDVSIFADFRVKHSSALGPERDVESEAVDLVERSRADAVLVTGGSTGSEADVELLATVREALPETPILVASGVSAQNVSEYAHLADGFIVGTAAKECGCTTAPVDRRLAREIAEAFEKHKKR
jgi:membrane complex biogenesis BtpA family protein